MRRACVKTVMILLGRGAAHARSAGAPAIGSDPTTTSMNLGTMCGVTPGC